MGEFFTGRGVPINPYQLRNESVLDWSERHEITVRDMSGNEFVPFEYGHLTAEQRQKFDKDEPRFTQMVEDWRLANQRPWAELDAVDRQTEDRIRALGAAWTDRSADTFMNGLWYREQIAKVLAQGRTEREDFFERNPAEFEPKTQVQKWSQSYQEFVIEGSMVEIIPGMPEIDWELFEERDHLWRRENGEEAGTTVDKEYLVEDDPTYQQYKSDRFELNPYFEFLDSVWCKEFIEEVAGGLPELSDGRSYKNFRTAAEYRAALKVDVYRVTMEQGRVPKSVAGIKTDKNDEKNLGQRFQPQGISGRLSSTQAKALADVLATYFMKDFYENRTEYRNSYLSHEEHLLEPLLRWEYLGNIRDLEEFLP
jgi:hypothetical protein